MPSQLGTFIQLNATGAASNLTLLGQAQRLNIAAQTLRAAIDLHLATLNDLISGATTANIETALGLITGQGTNYFNVVNGSSQAMYGTGENSQIINLGAQIGGP